MLTTNIFPDGIKNIAEGLGLSSWCWSAIIISFLSLSFAIWSRLVARRTLRSQQRTEENTTPVINKKIQLALINNKLNEAYESFIHLLVLQISLEHLEVNGNKYNVKPTNQFWNFVRISELDLFEHLFYNYESKFHHFHTLVNFIRFYNEDLNSLREILETNQSNANLKNHF